MDYEMAGLLRFVPKKFILLEFAFLPSLQGFFILIFFFDIAGNFQQ